MSLEALAKSGAIVSSAGVALMIVLMVVLLAFPVIKNCDGAQKCYYRSTAPGGLQSVVQPGFLAISLMTISAGVLILRFSIRLESKKSEKKEDQAIMDVKSYCSTKSQSLYVYGIPFLCDRKVSPPNPA